MAVSSAPRKKHKSSLSKPCLITLRIELVGTTPLVWRRITLDGRSSFANLHHVIQAAMGWHDAHLHQFRLNNRYIGVPDPESDAPDWHTEDERKVFLNRVLTDETVFTYLYDFGDGWEHKLIVEEYDDSDGPALYIYYARQGARIFDIARRYHARARDLAAANHLDTNGDPPQELTTDTACLLIPAAL